MYLGDGRVQTTTGMPVQRGPNGVPYLDGPICVGIGMTPVTWVSGMPYGPSGRICVQMQGSGTPRYFVSGLGFLANGRLACDDAAPIVAYVRGIPMTASGAVAIATPTVVASSRDADTLDGPAGK